MEFFIPGLLLFLVSILVVFLVIPRFTPLIVAILSIAFLSYGVYNHYTLFASEYRLSTWQESLKVYAPAIMIITILLYIIYTILAFFTSGSVPVPLAPSITEPNESSVTNQITKSLNKVANVFTGNNNTNNKNAKNGSLLNQVTNTLNNSLNTITNSLGITNNARRNNNNKPSRSFVETF
jgi:predicted PurR-regulated permease PerM